MNKYILVFLLGYFAACAFKRYRLLRVMTQLNKVISAELDSAFKYGVEYARNQLMKDRWL